MNKAEPPAIRAHEDTALFRDAVQFTAAESGFVPRLIEKDYFCTVLLDYLSMAAGAELVFKGGTCLGPLGALPPERGLRLYYTGCGGCPEVGAQQAS